MTECLSLIRISLVENHNWQERAALQAITRWRTAITNLRNRKTCDVETLVKIVIQMESWSEGYIDGFPPEWPGFQLEEEEEQTLEEEQDNA